MTERRIRYWSIKPVNGATVRKGGDWEVDELEGAYTSPRMGNTPPGWDRSGARDAPGIQIINPPERPQGELHEFVAGNPRVGGYYYQIATLYDPDLTARVIVFNVLPLSPFEFKDALNRINSKKDLHQFLFNAPLKKPNIHSDSGVMTDISSQ